MQKYLLLSLLATILGLLPLHAQEFTQGDFTFTVLDPEAKTVAVTGCTLPENSDVTIPATATLDDTEYTVTSLNSMSATFSVLRIPASITEINPQIYSDIRVYDRFLVENDNKIFTSYDGVLYSKDMTKLYVIPKNISQLLIPDGTISIETNACAYSDLTLVSLPKSIKRIESSAFWGCINLSTVDLPEELEFIGAGAFYNTALTSIYIPQLTKLEGSGISQFLEGPMMDISVHPENQFYSSYDGCLYSKDYSTLYVCPTYKENINFHRDVNKFGERAFAGNKKLKKLSVPNSVTTIEYGTFQMSSLEEVYLPGSIKVIPNSGFYGCSNLEKIFLSEGLEEIGFSAFYNCGVIQTIIIPLSVTTLNASAFVNCAANIIVPNSETAIIDDISPEMGDSHQPHYYAEPVSMTQIGLINIVKGQIPMTSVKDMPNVFQDMAFFIGPDSNITTSFKFNLDPAYGFQADFTLPKGLSEPFIRSSFYNSECKRLENGDYRLICYTSDHTTLGELPIIFTFKSDTNLERSKIIVHDIVLSLDDQEYTLKDKEAYVSGYEISFNGIPDEIEEYDTISLPNPLSLQYEDVSYQWEVLSGNAKITDNSTLQALSPGQLDFSITILDPMIESFDIGTSRTITPALWGDSNSSGAIDLADVVTTVNHILERNPEPFNAKLADVDRNGRINIVDVTSTVKLVLEQPIPDTPESDTQGAPAARELAFSEISRLENGKNILSLNLKPNTDYTALQTDLEVPADVTIEAISLGEGLSRHTVDHATVAPGVTRVILYSPSLTELAAGEEQSVLNITLGELPVNGTIRTLRTLACDAQGQSFTLGNAEKEFYTTTGISSAATASYSVRAIAGGIEISGAEGAAITVSDLQGRTVATAEGATIATRLSLAPGVYLVSATGQHPAKVLVK